MKHKADPDILDDSALAPINFNKIANLEDDEDSLSDIVLPSDPIRAKSKQVVHDKL